MINQEKIHKNKYLPYNLQNNQKYPSLLENVNFPFPIQKKDIFYFSLLINSINKRKIKIIYLKYISNHYNLKHKLTNNILSKNFIKQQKSLCFIYLYEYYNDNKLYDNLFKIITFLKNNSIIDNNDILEIIYYNIIFYLIEISNTQSILHFNKNNLFNLSINYLIQIIATDTTQISTNIIFNIFNSLHKFLIEDKKILFFFKKEKDYKNNSIIKINEINYLSYFINNKDNEEIIKIKNKINDILYLLYGFNINKNCTDYLLLNLQNSFIELNPKQYSKEKIISTFNKLNNQIDFINKIFIYEDNIISDNFKDIYMPKRYFVFNESNKSGINYNPNTSLLSNNFTLIFSFKQYQSKENIVYPLFTLINEEEIIFGIYLKNKNLCMYFQNGYTDNAQTEIILNKSYLVIIEYNRKKNELVELHINGDESKAISSGKIKHKHNTVVNIGYISEKINKKNEYENCTCNYIGIIGPILFFNKIIDDKDFINNIFKLKKHYDILLNLNSKTFIYNDTYNQDINSLNDDIINYFISRSKIIDEKILFYLNPISIINDYQIKNFKSFNYYNNINFIGNIYGKTVKDKNNLSETFSTLEIPLSYTGGTFPEHQISSSFTFIQNEGFEIITLNFEYFYNILKMLISLNVKNEYNNKDNSTIYYHINKSIGPLLNLINNIIKYSSNCISIYKNTLDTIGFSLLKIFKILINKTPLSSELLSNINSFLLNANRKYIRTYDSESKKVIINFINKILIMICDKKYFDMKNNKQLNDYISLFKIILKNNEYLIDSNILDLLLNFNFILDKRNFDNIEEYKKISREYKNLLKIFISQINTMKLHCEYIEKVCENEDNNILIKYKLIKLYYICNNIKHVYNQDNQNDTKEKINLFFNLFKINKKNKVYNTLLKEKLFKEYKRQFSKLLTNYNNNISKEDKKYLELLKCIFIQLIYEQSVLIIPSKLDINYLDPNLHSSDIQISFFTLDDTIKKNNIYIKRNSVRLNRREFYGFSIDNNIEVIENLIDLDDQRTESFNKELKHNSTKNVTNNEIIKIDLDGNNNLNNIEKSNSNEIKIYGLFDELMLYKDNSNLKNDINIRFYIFKSLFACFYDTWNKEYKLKFIKDINDNSYENFNMCFNDFNRFKQKLLFQYIQLLEIINNFKLYEKLTKLIYFFIKQIIKIYKSNQNEINSRRIYIHLFENKNVMNYLLDLCYNNNDIKFVNNKDLKMYVESSITSIINNILLFHHKPFIFSYIKNCIKNNKKYVITIIKNISDFIINDFKNNENENNSNILISFYYFNRIKFIITLKKSFQKYKDNSQNLLCVDNYILFNTINNLIEAYSTNYIIFDSNLYIYNSQSLADIYNKNNGNKEEEKKKDKKCIKMIKLPDTKIINSEGLFVIIVELSLHIIFLLWTVQGDFGDFVTRMNINEFISKLTNLFIKNEHLISYYIDLYNNFFSYSQPKKHLNLIRDLPSYITENHKNSLIIKDEYKRYIINNPYIEDNRIMSVINFLLFMKYKAMIMNFEYKKNRQNNAKEQVQKIFDNFVKKALGDVVNIYQNISKIKDDEKLKLFFERESKNSKKSLVTNIYQNNYKNFLESIKKKKMYFVSEYLINEIEKKLIKEIEEEENNKNNNLIESKISEKNLFQKITDTLYNSNNNTEYTNENNNKEEEKKNEFIITEEFTVINDDNIINDKDNSNNIDKNNDDNNKYVFTNYCTDAENPILCTKRDLILKNLGYFFYRDYFKDKNFINLKKTFMCLYPPNNPKNNYNNFDKKMSLQFPSTIKNYSNWDLYYPRIFFRPDKYFFDNKYFNVGHKYFKNDNKINKPNFEFGHGLLNQSNFNLLEINDNENNETKNFGIDESTPYYETELLCSNNNFQGIFVLKEKYFVYQTNMIFDFKKYKNDSKYILSSKIEEFCQTPKQVIIPYKNIEQIIKRKFLFFNQAFEIYLKNGKSYFFNLYKESICNNFFENIQNIKNKYNFEIIVKPNEYFFKKKYTSNWLDKKISTLEYLLKINKYSNRTYNDLTQYLVLPWTLKDYLDINDKQYFRDFSLPMAVQEKESLQIVKDYYEIETEENKSYFKCHYSNSSYVAIYLFRINPFTNNQIKLQNGKFDAPTRQISCFQDICIVFKDHKETCELIPEYYYLIESFLNLNFNFYGFLNRKVKNIVNNLKLTQGFDSLLELLLFHQNFLNSDEMSSNVHKWIDNIFGENQITDKKNVINSYPAECYEKNVKKKVENEIKELENNKDENINITKAIDNIKANFMITYLLGQCPDKLFNKSHPQYYGKNIDNNNFNKTYMKNECKSLSNKDFIYMSESNSSPNGNSDNNYFYIVTNKEILVFNKQMKPIANLYIDNIKKIYPSFECNNPLNIGEDNKGNNLNDNSNANDNKNINENESNFNILYNKQYIYKRLIFDIEDCKFFFIGGYIDNSYKIYFRMKEKSICYNYITNSIITCMKYMNNSNIYFTGHINGRIIKWKYNIIEKEKTKELNISCSKVSSILAHRSGVSLLEIHDNLCLLLSASDNDGVIFIRKLFDYELLSVIQYNNLNKRIIDINFDKEYIIINYIYKKMNNNNIQKIVTYSVNGIKFSKIDILNEGNNGNINDNVILPISLHPNNDNIFMFSKNKINYIKITCKNEMELLPIDENILKFINKGESNEVINQKKSDFIDDFNQNLKNKNIISYFYDFQQHLLFCLFNNGQMYRINLYPKFTEKKM